MEANDWLHGPGEKGPSMHWVGSGFGLDVVVSRKDSSFSRNESEYSFIHPVAKTLYRLSYSANLNFKIDFK
jgi:hypothetical protein